MKDLLLAILNIFRGLFGFITTLRVFVFNVLFLALLVIIVMSFIPGSSPERVHSGILNLSLIGDIIEQDRGTDPFNDLVGPYLGLPERPRETLLQDVLDVISAAEYDPNIEAILLDLDELGSVGLNQLSLIGSALSSFRAAGKQVVAAEDYYSQNQYYLAAHANKVFLNPMGGLYLSGYGLYRFYFKDALEKLRVNFHVFQVGSYKSALEPITRNSMSSRDRQQSREWLTALWDIYREDVSGQRGIEPAAINGYVNDIPGNLQQVGGDLAQLAQKYGLVDDLKYGHEITSYLAALVGQDSSQALDLVEFQDYLTTIERSYSSSTADKDTIALITAQGVITTGKSGPGNIGSDTIAALIRKAGEAQHIKALVFRVDSGGGSAFASEQIRQELLEFKKSGKPLIVSMGSFAASGGYWISADADEIWAAPSTLTGSIGIFMAFPTIETLLNNYGIYRDGVGTTNLSAGMDIGQPPSPELQEAIQAMLEHGYKTFISLVSKGRDMPAEEVEQLAQGRVFGGQAALEVGLVDRLGTLSQAIGSAADLAGLTDFSVSSFTPPASLTDRLFQLIGIESSSLFTEKTSFLSTIRDIFSFDKNLQSLLLFNDPNGMYALSMIDYTR
jgi:protease-4